MSSDRGHRVDPVDATVAETRAAGIRVGRREQLDAAPALLHVEQDVDLL